MNPIQRLLTQGQCRPFSLQEPADRQITVARRVGRSADPRDPIDGEAARQPSSRRCPSRSPRRRSSRVIDRYGADHPPGACIIPVSSPSRPEKRSWSGIVRRLVGRRSSASCSDCGGWWKLSVNPRGLRLRARPRRPRKRSSTPAEKEDLRRASTRHRRDPTTYLAPGHYQFNTAVFGTA